MPTVINSAETDLRQVLKQVMDTELAVQGREAVLSIVVTSVPDAFPQQVIRS